MKGYLSIGTVSKRKGISIKSLRYYDKIGVLRPAYINKKTNYRYYTEDQLYLLDAISLCIELGIPLREFEKYRDDRGNFHLQDLLYDGKLLAEQKILDIRKRLGTVQAALQALEHKKETPDPEPTEIASADEKKEFYRRRIPARAILTAALQEEDTENYSQKILRLFMLAQLLGMTAIYPSGIYYKYDAQGVAEKYIFIQVENYMDCTDKRLHILPAGTYFCKQETEHQIMHSERLRDIFQLSGKPFIVVESDLIDEKVKKEDNSLELQILKINQ